MKDSLELLRDIDVPLIAFFGSARVADDSSHAQLARLLAFELGKKGYGIISGGGPGIMKGASLGAKEAGALSVAMKTKMLPGEKIMDDLFTHEIFYKWMFVRRFAMSIRSHALVFFPGGLGTVNEFFEYAMLMQTGIVEKAPIILLGKEFYQSLLDWMKNYQLNNNYISKVDFELFHVEDNINKIIEIIENYTRDYGKLNFSKFIKQNNISREVLQNNRDLGQHALIYDGYEFVVFDQVFSPKVFNGWRVFTQRLTKENFIGKDLLEIGSGTGITGLYLYQKNGLNLVVLSDINPYAVANSRQNVSKFGLETKVKVVESNVFDQIPKDRKFDVIYWNYPWLPEEKEYQYTDEVDRGLFDPNYQYLKKYLHEAKSFLKPKGRIFLGFGDFGDIDYLTFLTKREGYILRELTSESGSEGIKVKFILYELIPE